MGVLFFDADNDQDQDLYLARGGSEQLPGSALYRDQLYLNNGQGHFERAAGALPGTHLAALRRDLEARGARFLQIMEGDREVAFEELAARIGPVTKEQSP